MQSALQVAWVCLNVRIRTSADPGKDDTQPHEALAAAVGKRICAKAPLLPDELTVLRKSYDPRKASGTHGDNSAGDQIATGSFVYSVLLSQVRACASACVHACALFGCWLRALCTDMHAAVSLAC